MTFGGRIGTKKVVYIGKWRAQILKCSGSCCSLYKSYTDDDFLGLATRKRGPIC